MAVEPIRPEEVEFSATKPDEVIKAFNEMILKHWDGTQARFTQMEVVLRIKDKLGTDGVPFSTKLLDVEHLYRRAGWVVEYDKPGYNETYPATFTFSKKEG